MTTKDTLALALEALETIMHAHPMSTCLKQTEAMIKGHAAITAIKQAQDGALIDEGAKPKVQSKSSDLNSIVVENITVVETVGPTGVWVGEQQAITPETGSAATPEASAITAGNGQQAKEPVETADLYGVKDGVEFYLGKVPYPPRSKAREIAISQFGHFEDDDGSDAELCFGALEQLVEWMYAQGFKIAHPAPKQAEPAHYGPLFDADAHFGKSLSVYDDAPKQSEPVQPSSKKTLALAQEGIDLHDHNAPEYIICAELVRLNKALSGAPTPPEAA